MNRHVSTHTIDSMISWYFNWWSLFDYLTSKFSFVFLLSQQATNIYECHWAYNTSTLADRLVGVRRRKKEKNETFTLLERSPPFWMTTTERPHRSFDHSSFSLSYNEQRAVHMVRYMALSVEIWPSSLNVLFLFSRWPSI